MQQPPSTTPDKKKRRISSMFHKKDNSVLVPPMLDHSLSHQGSSSTNGGIAADSAYASSDGPSSKRNSRAEIQPIENNGRIDGVSSDRTLDVNNRTGEVFDHETGEVVSTVTTTTTTTTTTVHKGPVGRKGTTVQVETHKHQEQDQTDRSEIAEAPGDRPRREESIRIAQSQQANLPTSTWRDDPPARNPNRKSRDFAESPCNHNFSYPSRTLLNEENPVSPITSAPAQPMFGAGNSISTLEHGSSPPLGHGASSSSSRPRSTLENLKTAAIGLHGVGETLRGTLNSEVDSRFPRHNAEKAAAADAKNRSTLERGNAELARLSGRSEWERNRDNRAGAPHIPPLYEQNHAPSRSPRPTHGEPALTSYPPPPSGGPPSAPATYTPSNPLSPALGNSTTIGAGPGFQSNGPGLQPHEGQHPAFRQHSYEAGDEAAHVQPAFTPESNGVLPVKKESRFGKLIKRRP